MSSKNIKTKNGFTIIEVVLVLAIAGLIFLMVFIALPQLQRAQRDTQRRSDLARVASAITQYQTNNSGKLPGSDANGASTAGSFVKNYLGGGEFVDPDGTYYTVKFAKATSGDTNLAPSSNDHTIYVYTNAICDGEHATSQDAQVRNFAVLYKLEGSGTYCADNQ